ncbi:MAG: HEPN domain-containing protein [Deltaproteobacteria bacterium]|nr:HEPN domain-containing protein [Deltaproteobacteria bacterium]
MRESSGDLVRYRLQRARETLEDARILANASRWNPCVNRLYYACFYAVSAGLGNDDVSCRRLALLTSRGVPERTTLRQVPCLSTRIFAGTLLVTMRMLLL